MIKTIEYIIPLDYDIQLRHIHAHWKNRVTSFTVQLEICTKNSWQPIVRYDTAHGFTHRDIIYADGRKDKTPLFITDFKEALDFSDKDLKNNWQIYREHFLKEARNE